MPLAEQLVASVPLTLPQYANLGGLGYGTAESWDRLRASDGPFAIPKTSEAWEAEISRPDLRARAAALADLVHARGAASLASYGVGTGALELALTEAAPSLHVACTDFAPNAVAVLAEHAPRLTVMVHDLARDAPLRADLHLFHRIDTEFGNRVWRAIFRRFERERILVCGERALETWAAAKQTLRAAVRRRGERAGYLRNDAALRSLWRATHDATPVDVADLRGYLLTPKKR